MRIEASNFEYHFTASPSKVVAKKQNDSERLVDGVCLLDLRIVRGFCAWMIVLRVGQLESWDIFVRVFKIALELHEKIELRWASWTTAR